MQGRAPRVDVVRNRGKLLEVSRVLVAKHGVDVPLDEIARQAELSSGTFYRHFPTRAHLIRALYDEIADRIEELIALALTQTTGWATFEVYVDSVLELLWQHPEATSVFAYIRNEEPEYRPGDEWVQPMLDTARRAHEEGSIRPDVSPSDLAYIPHLLGQLVGLPEPARGLMLARMRALLFDSVRPASAPRTPLPVVPLTVDQIRSLSKRRPEPAPGEEPRR